MYNMCHSDTLRNKNWLIGSLAGIVLTLFFVSTAVASVSELKQLIDVCRKIDTKEATGVTWGQHFIGIDFIKRNAPMYVLLRYRGETAEKWIMTWCHRSGSGKLFSVVLTDGTTKPASCYLKEKLDAVTKK